VTGPVDDMRLCEYCRQTLPAVHVCVAGPATPCPTESGAPCGACLTCLAQPDDLARRSDIETPQGDTRE
jgi:hypothetical protein